MAVEEALYVADVEAQCAPIKKFGVGAEARAAIEAAERVEHRPTKDRRRMKQGEEAVLFQVIAGACWKGIVAQSLAVGIDVDHPAAAAVEGIEKAYLGLQPLRMACIVGIVEGHEGGACLLQQQVGDGVGTGG